MIAIRSMAAALVISFTLHSSSSFAVDTRFTWMLPKTVIDTTVGYTFESCKSGSLKVKIAPTLISRAVPDTVVGRMALNTDKLQSFWQDRNISIQTFGSSHILNSIGSSPTSQVAQIGGNIFGALAKIVAIGVGIAPADAGEGPPRLSIDCATGDGSAQAIADRIVVLKKLIQSKQDELASGVDEATQKKDNAAIQAAQSASSTLQDQLTITIKTTIDPGISPTNVDPDSAGLSGNNSGSVQQSGLVATICPSIGQLKKAKWFADDDLDNLPKAQGAICSNLVPLQVNVYLDLENGQGTMYGKAHSGAYQQTDVDKSTDLYRDVAYIPVLVWRGERPTNKDPKALKTYLDREGSPSGPIQLGDPKVMPFGQFGVSQMLPLTAGYFKSLTWQVTFLEDGEITAASFLSKATGLNATAFFGSAVNAANSIATEERNANSSSSQANALQAQSDLIYQTHRLQICQGDPANCPSK